MFFRKFVCICTLAACVTVAAYAQPVPDLAIVPLTVDAGFPIQVMLTEKLSYKEDEPVHARVVEPVYAFDREVIPSGTEVAGRITGFKSGGAWKRVLKMLEGDFTPIREPEITFDEIVLPNGSRMPIETSSVLEPQQVIRFTGEKDELVKNLKSEFRSTIGPSAKEGLKNMFLNMLPYHPQSLPSSARFKVLLNEPLQFGAAVLHATQLDEISSQPPAGAIVSARVITPLDSRTAKAGAPVEALLIEPLFSPSNRVVFPAGSKLRGRIEEAKAARKGHRNGELAFRFTSIELPRSLALGTMLVQPGQEIEGTLTAAQVSSDLSGLHIDKEGDASIQESKKRFIAPAMSFLNAGLGLNATSNSFGRATSGAYLNHFLGGVWGNGSGFGVPASIVGSMFPPVGIGFRFFSAVRSAYSTFLGRGQDVKFPTDTRIEVRIESPARR